MKKLILTSLFALLAGAASLLTAQNQQQYYLGLPGDNLNLFAVMSLFQESETLEQFERDLNDPERMINNLDLNGDNFVDYIMVLDYMEDNLHTIVLRVALSRYEFQDVAVFTVERFRDGSVQVQLIGDEALYGPNYIIEPIYAERANPGYRGNVQNSGGNAHGSSGNVTIINNYHRPAQWPVIVYMSRPVYSPWRSAWVWGYHPMWWSPWNPHYWHFYYGYHYHWNAHHFAHFHMWSHPRCRRFNTVYMTNIRHYSPTVVVMINDGGFRHTYSQPQMITQGEVQFAQRQAGRYGTAPEIGSAKRSLEARHGSELQSAQGRHGTASPNQINAASSSPNQELRSSPAASPANNTQQVTREANVNRQNAATQNNNNNAARQQPNVDSRQAPNQRGTVTGTQTPRQNPSAIENNVPQRNRPATQPQRTPARGQNVESQARPARQTVSQPARQTPSSNQRPAATTAPARQNNPAPARNVNQSAPQRNTNATQNTRPNVSSGSSRPSQPAVSSQPARAPERQAPQARPAQNTNNTNASTPSSGRTASPQRSSGEQDNSNNSRRR